MLRKIIAVTIIAILFSPFGFIAQAETGNTVNDMLEAPEERQQDGNELEAEITPPAEQNQTEQDPLTFENQFSWFDFVKMFLSLGVVIALIYSILRLLNKKNKLYGQMRAMENLGGLSLGTNRSIQLVRIGDRVFIVGVGETVQLLKEITEPEEIEQLTSNNQSPTLQVRQTLLNKWIPTKEQEGQSKSNGTSGDFRIMLKEQLSDLSEGRKKLYDKFKRDHEE